MMKVNTFIEKLLQIDRNRTAYMWGSFGNTITENFIQQKRNQYPNWYTPSKQRQLRGKIGWTAFDCIGLIKGVLWGFPNTRYNSNGVPDINADMTINRCKNVSTDFSKIKVGSAVWLPGHIGVYIGNDKIIEATPSFGDGVVITNLANVGNTDFPTRRWVKHGELPWVDYSVEVQSEPKPEYVEILEKHLSHPQDWVGFIEEVKDHPTGRWLPNLLVSLGSTPNHEAKLKGVSDNPQVWISFIEEYKEHRVGKFLPELINKIEKA